MAKLLISSTTAATEREVLWRADFSPKIWPGFWTRQTGAGEGEPRSSVLDTSACNVVSTSELTFWEELRLALAGSALLHLALAVTFGSAWRRIWKLVPGLNQWLYPDLNGAWDVSINWERLGEKGHTQATAHIRQTLTQLSMTLQSDKSESSTICFVPKKHAESGHPVLHYLYDNVPVQGIGGDHQRHVGAATLNVGVSSHDELTGKLFH